MSCNDWSMHYVYVGDYACDYVDILYVMMNCTWVVLGATFSNYFKYDVQNWHIAWF